MKPELHDGRDLRPEWVSEWVSVLVFWSKGRREEGRGRPNRTGWREGEGKTVERETERHEWAVKTVLSCRSSVWLEKSEVALGFPAPGLKRGRARQAIGDRSRSMGHSASSETVAQQPAQHNTGESKAKGSVLNGSREYNFDGFLNVKTTRHACLHLRRIESHRKDRGYMSRFF